MRTALAFPCLALVVFTFSACSTAAPETDWQKRAADLTPGQLQAIRDKWEGPKPYTDDLIRPMVAKECAKLEEGATLDQIVDAVGTIERGADERPSLATYKWEPWWIATIAHEGCPELLPDEGGS